MKKKFFIEINKNLFLTFSANQNLKILKAKHIDYTICRDKILNDKIVYFKTMLFESNKEVVVSFRYGPDERLLGLDCDVNIQTIENF